MHCFFFSSPGYNDITGILLLNGTYCNFLTNQEFYVPVQPTVEEVVKKIRKLHIPNNMIETNPVYHKNHIRSKSITKYHKNQPQPKCSKVRYISCVKTSIRYN